MGKFIFNVDIKNINDVFYWMNSVVVIREVSGISFVFCFNKKF